MTDTDALLDEALALLRRWRDETGTGIVIEVLVSEPAAPSAPPLGRRPRRNFTVPVTRSAPRGTRSAVFL